MNRTGPRLVLALLAVVGLITAAWYVQVNQQRLSEQREALTRFEQTAHPIVVSTLELRAAQQAYVAAGQGEGYWGARVRATIQSLSDDLLRLRQLTLNAASQAAIDVAAEQVPKLRELDKRAIDYARGDQRLMASDLIFTDGLEATRTIIDQVQTAAVKEREAMTASVAVTETAQVYAALAAGLLAVIVLIALARVAKRDEVTEAMMLAQPSRAQEVELLSGLAHASTTGTQPRPTAAAGLPGGDPETHLAAAAELCTEFARVIDPGELPSLLQRSAKLLDAKGLIVWITDPTGVTLRPALAHGYSSQALSMMGTLPRDGDTATSAAYREGRIETVTGDSTSMAALVVPLMSASGCVGAVAVELPSGYETRPATQALATIVAAQLAALVAVPPIEPASAQRTSNRS